MNILWYALASAFGISLISFIGVLTLSFGQRYLLNIISHLMSFAAGTLLGNVFFHLVPKAISLHLNPLTIGSCILLGIFIFFILEKILHWHQAHSHPLQHIKPFGIMNLLGDTLHNFIDGIALGVSYVVSLPLGISSTIAIALHEIPQEFSDFGILLHARFSVKKALWYNFLSGISAITGTLVVFFMYTTFAQSINFLIPFTAGGFIYIAASNLIPELHKDKGLWCSIMQIFLFLSGGLIMLGLALID